MGRLLKRIGSREKLSKMEMTAPLLGRDSGEGGGGGGVRGGSGAGAGGDGGSDESPYVQTVRGEGGGSDVSGGSQRSSLDDAVSGASVAQVHYERTVSGSSGDGGGVADADAAPSVARGSMLARLLSLGAHIVVVTVTIDREVGPDRYPEPRHGM